MSTDNSTAPAPAPGAEPKPGAKWLMLAGALGIGTLVAAVFYLQPRTPPGEPPPVYGRLPAFALTTQDAAPFTLDTMKGQVWVANFIFTRCPTVCPATTKRMASIQQDAQKGSVPLHSVSFSVDPEFDTPERLKKFAAKYQADERHWTFVTGSLEPMEATIVDGFRIAMGREALDGGGAREEVNIFHGEQFVLVDQRGEIRGYYSPKDDSAAVTKLLRDAAWLAASPERPKS